MPEEKKQFPTPSMLKAREEWAKKSQKEKEEIEKAFREKLKNYYENRPSAEMIRASMEENQNN